MVPRMMDDTAGNILKQWCVDKGVRVLTSHSITSSKQANTPRQRAAPWTGWRSGRTALFTGLVSWTSRLMTTGLLLNPETNPNPKVRIRITLILGLTPN